MRIVELDPPLHHRPRPRGAVIDTIVLHATAGGTLSGAIETLRDRGLGYHYLIEKSGRVTKAVPSLRETSHAGNSYGPREASRGVPRDQKFVRGKGWVYTAGSSVNGYSIGIGLVNWNDGKDPYPTEQVEACRDLIAALVAALPSLKYLTTHYGVSHRRKTDPQGLDVVGLAAEAGLEPWKVPEATWPTPAREGRGRGSCARSASP